MHAIVSGQDSESSLPSNRCCGGEAVIHRSSRNPDYPKVTADMVDAALSGKT